MAVIFLLYEFLWYRKGNNLVKRMTILNNTQFELANNEFLFSTLMIFLKKEMIHFPKKSTMCDSHFPSICEPNSSPTYTYHTTLCVLTVPVILVLIYIAAHHHTMLTLHTALFLSCMPTSLLTYSHISHYSLGTNYAIFSGPNIKHYSPSHFANTCLLYTSPSPRDMRRSRMPSSA